MFLWQDMSSISVFVLGREIRMIDVSPCIDQLFDRIKQKIRDEEGIPTRFMAVQTGLDDTYFAGLHSFKRIQNMDGDLLTEVKKFVLTVTIQRDLQNLELSEQGSSMFVEVKGLHEHV